MTSLSPSPPIYMMKLIKIFLQFGDGLCRKSNLINCICLLWKFLCFSKLLTLIILKPTVKGLHC